MNYACQCGAVIEVSDLDLETQVQIHAQTPPPSPATAMETHSVVLRIKEKKGGIIVSHFGFLLGRKVRYK